MEATSNLEKKLKNKQKELETAPEKVWHPSGCNSARLTQYNQQSMKNNLKGQRKLEHLRLFMKNQKKIQ